MHAGTSISTGERWVLVIRVIAKKEARIARRAHVKGLDLIRSMNLLEAKIAF
jgi:hypothetical protein